MNSTVSTQQWQARIDKTSAYFKEHFEVLTPEQLTKQPNDQSWSVAQIIDHLSKVSRSYYPIFDQISHGTYRQSWAAKLNFLTDFFGKLILKSVQPANQKKTKTLSPWAPTVGDSATDVIPTFLENQERLKQLIVESKELIENNFVISSPANRMVVYTVGTAFEIIVSHQERHLEQAKRVAMIVS